MKTDNTTPGSRCMLNNRKGFTLIEVMAVLVLLSVVAAVAYSRFSAPIATAQTNGRATEINHTITDIQKASQSYQLNNNGTAPANTAALVSGGFLSVVPAATYTIVYTGLGSITYTNATVVNAAFCTSFTTLFPGTGMECDSTAGTVVKAPFLMQ